MLFSYFFLMALMSFSKAAIVLLSVKLYNEDFRFFIKPIKSLINILNSNGPNKDIIQVSLYCIGNPI